MFYFFSKLLAFLIRPSVWILVLLLLAFWKYRQQGKRYLVGALAVFFVFGNNALLQLALKWWEPLPAQLEQTYSKAIVLGGYMEFNPLEKNALPEFGERAERLTHALALYQQGIVDTIVFTGGSGGLLHEQPAEASVVEIFVQQLGYSTQDFIFEDEAVNTHENATKTAPFIRSGETVVLVTSAFHLHRSVACFAKQGIDVVPYPVDYLQSLTPLYPADYLLPKPAALWYWEILIKEWIGYVVYRMKGYV